MDVDDLYEHVGREGTREATRERRHRYLDHILNCETLPHQGLQRTPEVLRAKALFLGLMVRKLLRVAAASGGDDRDPSRRGGSTARAPSSACSSARSSAAVQKSFSVQLHRLSEAGKLRCTNVGVLVAGKKLTQAFRSCARDGQLGHPLDAGNTAQNGVSQQLGRMTTTSTLALLRKVSTPIARETKNPKPRQLATSGGGSSAPWTRPRAAPGLSMCRLLATCAWAPSRTRCTSSSPCSRRGCRAARSPPRSRRRRRSGATACRCSSTACSPCTWPPRASTPSPTSCARCAARRRLP